MPELPTIAEAGVRSFAMDNWYAVFAPAVEPLANTNAYIRAESRAGRKS